MKQLPVVVAGLMFLAAGVWAQTTRPAPTRPAPASRPRASRPAPTPKPIASVPATATRPTLPAGVMKFDFGPAKSNLMDSHTAVTHTDAYDAQKGYGFTSFSKGNFGSSNTYVFRPDNLAGDYVLGEEWTFRVDLPNGEYKVEYVAFNTKHFANEFRVWSIAVGSARYEYKPSAEHFFSKDWLYFGMDDDYYPGKDYRPYFEHVWPSRTAEVKVEDGKLEVVGHNAAIAGMVIYPKASAEVVERDLKIDHDVRYHQFLTRSFKLTEPKLAEPAPTDEQKAAGLIVFFPRSIDKVMPDSLPATDATETAMKAGVAQGERSGMTVAVCPLKGFDSAELLAADLIGPDNAKIPASALDVRLVRYFEMPQGSGSGKYAVAPHQLVKRATKLYPNMTRQFWVILKTPADAKPGVYKGNLTLKADGTKANVPVEVTVYPFALPETKLTVGWYAYDVPVEGMLMSQAPGGSLTLEQVLDRQIADMREHGCNSMQVPLPGGKGVEDGKMVLDYAKLETIVKVMKKHDMGTKHMPMTYSLGLGRRLANDRKEYSPEFNEVLKKSVVELHEWWKKHGIEVLFWVVDEPREDPNPWNRNLANTIKYLKLYREIPGVKTSISPMADLQDKKDYTVLVDEMDILQTHPWKKSTKLIAKAAEAGKDFWSYNGGYSRFSFGFSVWKLKAKARYQWHYQWPDTNYVPFVGYQWAMVYPTPEGLTPVWHYEQTAIGCNDYRYIELLLSSMADAIKAGKDVSKAQSLLKEMDEVVPQWPNYGLTKGDEVGGEADTGKLDLDQLRARLAEEIIRLQK